MYGTIARLKVRPRNEAELRQREQEMASQIPGLPFHHVYRTDADPHVLFLVVAFESEEAYRANAESPEQHARYEAWRALLEADPEWHNGVIIDFHPG